jgi:hypothetical protein
VWRWGSKQGKLVWYGPPVIARMLTLGHVLVKRCDQLWDRVAFGA